MYHGCNRRLLNINYIDNTAFKAVLKEFAIFAGPIIVVVVFDESKVPIKVTK